MDIAGRLAAGRGANIRTGASPRFPILAQPVVRRRFASESVSLHEWHCAGHESAHAAEEWTDAYEVVVPRRGAFQWEVRGERVLADPGTATFVHPDEPYRVRHPVPGGDAGSVFRLTRIGAAALLEEHDARAAERERPQFPVSHAPLDGRAYLLARLAIRATADPAATALEVEERSLGFLRQAVAQAHRRREGRAGHDVGNRRALEYAVRVGEVVAKRYREPLTLADLADEVGCSPFHLSRMITTATGVPIYRMILRRRLREALELLLETRDSIAQVALAVGFATHSHLTGAFRREFGVLPRSLRAPRR